MHVLCNISRTLHNLPNLTLFTLVLCPGFLWKSDEKWPFAVITVKVNRQYFLEKIREKNSGSQKGGSKQDDFEIDFFDRIISLATNVPAGLGKPHRKNIAVHLGIAQIAIGPPPAVKRALCGTYFRAKSCKCPSVLRHFS